MCANILFKMITIVEMNNNPYMLQLEYLTDNPYNFALWYDPKSHMSGLIAFMT